MSSKILIIHEGLSAEAHANLRSALETLGREVRQINDRTGARWPAGKPQTWLVASPEFITESARHEADIRVFVAIGEFSGRLVATNDKKTRCCSRGEMLSEQQLFAFLREEVGLTG